MTVKSKNHCTLTILMTAAITFTGCSPEGSSDRLPTTNDPKTIRIVTTVGMIADLVQQVGGRHVNVTQLMGPGVDPHLYKANRDDIQSILDSDLVFFSGHHLEGKMAETLEKLGEQKPIIALAEQLDESRLVKDEQSQADPHLWMDVSLWAGVLQPISESLAELLPEHAYEFRDNAASVEKQLAELHQYGIQAIASIPEDQRQLITSHDAFQYFGLAYNIEVLGIQGLSTESEAGLQRINQLVDLITEQKINAIFIESSVPQKNINSLIEGAKSRGHEVKIGGELYSDAMGEPSSMQGTYVGMMAHNIATVARALGGKTEDFPIE